MPLTMSLFSPFVLALAKHQLLSQWSPHLAHLPGSLFCSSCTREKSNLDISLPNEDGIVPSKKFAQAQPKPLGHVEIKWSFPSAFLFLVPFGT